MTCIYIAVQEGGPEWWPPIEGPNGQECEVWLSLEEPSFGGTGGEPFDDYEVAMRNGYITAVNIRHGARVDAIQMTYGSEVGIVWCTVSVGGLKCPY